MLRPRLFIVMFLVMAGAVLTASAGIAFVTSASPCWIPGRGGALSQSCAREQIQAAVGSKNLEVTDIRTIRIAGEHERKVEFRSRVKVPHDDDSANIVFVDSVAFTRVGRKWRLDASSLHW